MRKLLAIAACITTFGCMTLPENATVHDCMAKKAGDPEYRIVAIDGGPENRFKHPYMKEIDFIHVEPGTHKFTIQSSKSDKRETITAKIMSGGNYKVHVKDDGSLTIVSQQPEKRAVRPFENQ